jgi:ribonucleoside-triphosphate reductase
MSPIKTNKRTECTVYSRVVGWLTPVSNWNKGKKSEYNDRKTYGVSEGDVL